MPAGVSTDIFVVPNAEFSLPPPPPAPDKQMNNALFEQSFDGKVYGAVSFREVDSNAGAFDYTVHVSLSSCF